MSAREMADLLDRMRDLPEFVELNLADVNQAGNFGNTPLHVAATWGDVDAIKLLIEHGARIDAEGEDGLTPLHSAAVQGNAQAVGVLLDHGANAAAAEVHGHTALELAIALGHSEVASLLKARA